MKTVLSLKGEYDPGPWRCGILVRSLTRQWPAGTGRRSLVALQWRAQPNPRWTLRFFAVSAWGDDVDLVSAVVPFAGLVLPRHWGKWRSETGLGMSFTDRSLAVRLGAGVRRPEPGRGYETEAWFRAAVDWRW